MADFNFHLNRQGPVGKKGEKGEKGKDGNTPIFSEGTNTATEYTLLIDYGDGNIGQTGNLRPPVTNEGGTYVRYNTQTGNYEINEADIADLNRTQGEVTLASVQDVINEIALDTDAVSMELRNQDLHDIDIDIQEIEGVISNLDSTVTQNSEDIEALDGRLDTAEGTLERAQDDISQAQQDIVSLDNRVENLDDRVTTNEGAITTLQTGKANVVHTHTISQITDAGALASQNVVDYQSQVINKPTIPTVGDGTITITQGGVTKGTFTTNQSGNSTIELDAGGGGVNFETGIGLELTQQNVLNVKIDGTTITTNASGELVANSSGGTTYTAGNGIDLTNDEISVKYDNDTLKLNGTGQLYADIPAANDATITITQGGVTKGTFTTNQNTDTTIALDGADLTNYYTKIQADNKFIDNSVVQTPLEYLPDTISSITLHNINSTTLTDTRNNGYYTVDIVSGAYCHQLFLRDSVNNTYINLMENPTAINLDNLSYAEIQLRNGINIEYSISSNNIVGVLGYYDNGIFVPKFVREAINASKNALAKVENTARNFWQNNTLGIIYGMYKEQNNTNLVLNGMNNTGTSGTINSFTLSQQESDDLDACTHCRLIAVQGGPNAAGNSTINLNNIRFINPATSVTSGTTSDQYNTFINSDNLLDVHPESLSLKYDSSTLGVNASNELTVPTATTSNLGLVKPDGSTITINNGVISAASSTPSNMVTTDTSQTITGQKKFTDYTTFYGEYGPVITSNMNDVNAGRGIRFSSQSIRLRGNGYSTGIYLSSYGNLGQNAYDFSILQSNNITYFNQDPYISDKRIFRNNTSSNFLLEKDMLDGTTITYNSSTGKISAAGSTPTKKTITQASANISESSGTVTVTDADVTTSTMVSLYPSDTDTETWLASHLTSNIISEGTGSFTFSVDDTLPATFSMYYIIQGVS